MTDWSARALERLRSPVLDAVADLPGVWVVGGAVRDALLGMVPRMLDLVVDGDAGAVVDRLGAPRAVHQRFGTATVDGADVAAARQETYARPGALPDVVLGATIEQDLGRRDFTVNALAVRVADGEGAAWPGALDDLDARRLRVLHERSFLDDPTRLLRLARFAARLGFEPDEQTARLAAEAVTAGALETVTGPRLGAELRLALGEPLPAALLALDRDGLAQRILDPAFRVDPALVDRTVAAATRPGADPGLAALGACLLDVRPADVRAALDRLAFGAAERDAVAAAAAARGLAETLGAAGSPSQVAAAARGAVPEALAVADALGASEAVQRWLDEYRHVALLITGDDLLAAGLSGPAIGAGLRAALDAALDGTAPDRATQLRVATEGVA